MRFTDRAGPENQPRNLEDQEKRGEEESAPPREAGLRDRIAHFTWPWFAVTMSTGALSVVLAQTPNRFTGLQTIGKIYYILTIVLFLLFTGMIATRFLLVPRKLTASLHHPVEGLFFGAYWVSVSLILNGAQAYGGTSTGPWFNKAMEICFWTYCAVVFVVAVAQYFVFFQNERLNVAEAMPAWIFPIYPLLVVGPLAATLIPHQEKYKAWDMWVGAVALQGLAWTVALMMYSIYTQRLMGSQLPAPPTRPGMYVSVGPAGYTSAALFALGSRAPDVIPSNGWTTSIADGDFIENLGIVAGLFVVLFSFWFFCISTVSVLSGVRRMKFTLNWWAFVFPNAGLCLAAIQAGKVLNSPGINGLCSALTILLVIMWFVCAIAHIRAIWKGQLLWPGKDEDKDMKGVRWGRRAAF